MFRLHKTFSAAYPCLCMGVDILEDCLRELCLNVPSNSVTVEDTRLLMQHLIACTNQLSPLKKAFIAVDLLRISAQTLSFIERPGVFTLEDGTHMLHLPPTNNNSAKWPCQFSRQEAILLYNAMLQMHPNNSQMTQQFGYAHADEIHCTTCDNGKITACRLCGLPFGQLNVDETSLTTLSIVQRWAARPPCTLDAWGAVPPLLNAGCVTNAPERRLQRRVYWRRGARWSLFLRGAPFTLHVESVCTTSKTFKSMSHQYSTTQLLAQILKYDRMTPVKVTFPSLPMAAVTTVLTARPGSK